jgi:D-glycero-D-manno-heptose 1,7-bisphosphate phosphatase
VIDQAILLAGGKGSRLGFLTEKMPKPLLPVAGRAFLEYLIWNLKRHGITRIFLTVGYLAGTIKRSLGDGNQLGVQLEYITESTPLGTGGALAGMRDILDDNFFVMNGDTIFDVNYWALAQIHRKSDSMATIALREINNRNRFSSIRIDGCRIIAFEEKKESDLPGLINGGVYLFNRKIIEYLPKGSNSLEDDLFPSLIADGKRHLAGMPCNGFFIDIGLPETYNEAQQLIPVWQRRAAIFFEHNCVIYNFDISVHQRREVHWAQGAKKAIRWGNENGFLVMMLINHSGSAEVDCPADAPARFDAWIANELAERGGHFDAIYHFPTSLTIGNAHRFKHGDCRKKKAVVFERADMQWVINKENSLLIGDSKDFLQAAKSYGIRSFNFKGGDLYTFTRDAATPLLKTARQAPQHVKM